MLSVRVQKCCKDNQTFILIIIIFNLTKFYAY